MRLNEWRKTAPSKESMSSRVLAVLRPVLVDLGCDSDAECWVSWGEDPDQRYAVLAPTVAGLVTVNVRPSDPTGPRATAKLVRWTKLAVTELGIEASGGHRMVGVQVESFVLKGLDEEADHICEFVRGLIAGIDGRNTGPMPITVVQAAAAMGSIVALPDQAPAKAAPKRDAGEPKTAPVPKPASGGSPKIVPIASKAASRPALKPDAAPQVAPAAWPAPAAPAAPALPQIPPTPIAARAAAAQHNEQTGTVPAATRPEPEKPEPEAERMSEWVGPHPIEEKPEQPPKLRPWTP